MKKSSYQIDRLDSDGQPDAPYEIIEATSAQDALEKYLDGWDMSNFVIQQNHVNGIVTLTAACPDETDNVWRVVQVGDTTGPF